MFLTHLFACPCGSIISGHRRAFDVMMPLSIEKESLGSPSMFHARILTGSPSVSTVQRELVRARPFSARCTRDPVRDRRARGSRGERPQVRETPDAMSTSPVMLVNCSPSEATPPLQRSFSPPRPPISFSRAVELGGASSTCSAKSSFLAVVSSNCSCSAGELVLHP